MLLLQEIPKFLKLPLEQLPIIRSKKSFLRFDWMYIKKILKNFGAFDEMDLTSIDFERLKKYLMKFPEEMGENLSLKIKREI